MKKRLLSLLVALCMLVALLPVSAFTAAAEESGGAKLQIADNGYPVLDNVPHQTVNGHEIYTGDDWTYDADENCKILTLCPSKPTKYNFYPDTSNSVHLGTDGNVTSCNLVIGENATVTDGRFNAAVTNNGRIIGGYFFGSVVNHSTFTEGHVYGASFENASTGVIEFALFRQWFDEPYSLTNKGTINGGIFQDKPMGGKISTGYTLIVEKPAPDINVSVFDYGNSCYIVPSSNPTYPVNITVSYWSFYDSISSFPIDVVIGETRTLLPDWCGTKIVPVSNPYEGFDITFTAPPANGVTEVTLCKLTRMIDTDGYPVGTKGGTQNYTYTGEGWIFENDSLILEPTAEKSYDFNSTERNPNGVAVNCPVTVNSNATITNGIFLKEVTGSASALNGVFLKVPNGCESKKITVSDNGTITALRTSGDATTLESAAKELYVVGQPTESTLYVTLSSGKVREVKLPLTADLELQLNDPKPEPKPEPEPEIYTLNVVGGSFTTGGSDAQSSGTVPVNAEANVTLNPDAVPEGMVFDQWTISEESLLGNPHVAYNAESFTIPANTVAKGTTVTVEAQFREASIESEGPGVLGTAAMVGTVGAGAAVLGYTGYMIGTELYLTALLPAGAAIPTNTGELALLLWETAGSPAPAAVMPPEATALQKALAWAAEQQLIPADKAADASVTRWEVIDVWNKAKG